MKRILLFLLFAVGLTFAQGNVFEFKSADQKWDRWDNTSYYYVWDINAFDRDWETAKTTKFFSFYSPKL
jgi:hypothetical protein